MVCVGSRMGDLPTEFVLKRGFEYNHKVMIINDTVHVQLWIPYSKYLVMCLRFVVDTVQYMVRPWVFHDGSLPSDPFGQIEVLMDNGFDPILLAGNSARSRAMHGMFLGRK